MNKERLLNAARAVRESPQPKEFTMTQIHECGTPACVLGHYAARRDLQQMFQLSPNTSDSAITIGVWGASRSTQGWMNFVAHHFGITVRQADELFGGFGCGNAKTPIQAADYIERFVRSAA